MFVVRRARFSNAIRPSSAEKKERTTVSPRGPQVAQDTTPPGPIVKGR